MKSAESVLKNNIIQDPAWDDYLSRYPGRLEYFIDAMKAYAREACAEQRRICAENADINHGGYDSNSWIEEESILNAPEPEML
jgi:hypothetical protein